MSDTNPSGSGRYKVTVSNRSVDRRSFICSDWRKASDQLYELGWDLVSVWDGDTPLAIEYELLFGAESEPAELEEEGE